MNPIHKEKYILSKETYGKFTLEQNKAKILAKKRGIKLTAWVQILSGVLFIAALLFTKQTGMFVFSIFAVIMVIIGIHGLKKKYPNYDNQIWQNIENSWQGKGFDQNWFEIKFFEDRMKYIAGENIDELCYTDFINFYETEDYFAMHFITGDLILFNPDCNKEKIRGIIADYKAKAAQEANTIAEETAETAEAVAETTETVAETVEE